MAVKTKASVAGKMINNRNKVQARLVDKTRYNTKWLTRFYKPSTNTIFELN